ncbi:MAG TPA: hypothetical protein VLK33_22450, partial [Terriglobales bacterium]|nr:hypothetical protein [Terriglobales bacterium]
MKNNKFTFGTLALFTGLLLSTSASAKEHKPKMSDNQAKVIAHLTFAGQTPLNMALQKQGNDKYYLYVQQNNQSVSIIDIAKPTRPKAISEIADPTLVSAVNLRGNLAIVQNQAPAMSDLSAKDDLVLWDFTDPKTPRVVQKFSGVVKW